MSFSQLINQRLFKLQHICLLVPFFFLSIGVYSQGYSLEEKIQGYAVRGDTSIFIFDEQTYNVKVDKVVVTGSFRDWDASMTKEDWFLKKELGIWVLKVNEILAPNTKFKFRMNDGAWMNPPQNAPNLDGGDLVFMPQETPPTLKAELKNASLIWAYIPEPRPLMPEDYIITDAKGAQVKVSGVLPNESMSTLLVPAIPLDIKKVYFLEVPSLHKKVHISFDGWFRERFSTKELGAVVSNNATTFSLFAPRATAVKLYLYKKREGDKAFKIVNLIEDKDGVWELTINENLHGTYYDYTIHGHDDPGNHFYETNPVHVNDPYARVSDDTWGRARVWEKTIPATPLKDGIPEMQDVIAYEVHVQDFTDHLPVKDEFKGTFKAMTQRGLINARGEKVGFDYLLDLGINVLHLMPVQEYVHFPDDDWLASFKDDKYMISQGINLENYQWGYRTTFAMAVESRYRTKGRKPGAEREEFRDLVQAFHNEGIAVIIDIVPNHTGENMDANEWYFNFNAIDKQYYYRTKDFEHIGAYGNEVKTENRPMVQRWLIDQCKQYIDEFGVDGFRIDLAGQIDKQTLKALIATIGEDKIIYGEPWIASNDPDYESNPSWDWYKADSPITFFQDDSRNAFKGPVFELNNKLLDRGWPGGKFDERSNVMKGLSNKFPDDKSPLSGISYLDIHDNFALADQFGSENFDGRHAVDQDEYKIAVTLLYTTLGPIVTHGGSEIMRSKADAPLQEVVKTTQEGYNIYLHGYRDTYNHRFANRFNWDNVGKKPEGNNQNDYENMYRFWRGMNQFRLSEYGQCFRVAESVSDDYYQWILPEDESMLGYIVDQKVYVLLNASQQEKTFSNLQFPDGQWRLIATTDEVNLDGIKDKKIYTLHGETVDVSMEPTSLHIWVKE